MDIPNTLRPLRLTTTFWIGAMAILLAGLCTAGAAITPYGYYAFGTSGNPGADTSGKGFNMSNFTGVGGSGDPGNTIIIPNFGVGGPLGGTNGNAGITSTSAARTHAGGGNGGVFWVNPGGTWNLQYSNNWVMECSALANKDGARSGVSGAYIASIGHYTGTGGGPNLGASWGCILFATNYVAGSGVVYAQCLAVDPTGASLFQIGPDVLLKNGDSDNRWMHLAVVRDNLAGNVTFYTNGVVCAATNASAVRQNPVDNNTAAMPGFAGAQGGPIFGAAIAFEGYMDELRYASFADGQFSVTNFLTRAPGPSIVVQPQSVTVWAGGSAPLHVEAAYDTSLTYQWYRGGGAVSGATSNTYTLPVATIGDSGAQFTCVLTDYTGISKTSSVAMVTVVNNNPSNLAVYQELVRTNASILAYFKVDGSSGGSAVSNVVDNSGLYDGLIENDVRFDGATNHAFGSQALWFPGATVLAGGNGDVTINNNPAYEFSGGFGSVEAVLYMDSSISGTLATETGVWFGEQLGYYTLRANSGSLICNVGGNAAVTWTVPGGLTGKATHVVIAFDNFTNVTAYVNGQSLGVRVLSAGGFAGAPFSGLPFYIGSDGSNPTAFGQANNLWHGAIDELSLYGTNLSSDTILEHFNTYFFGTNTTPGSVASLTPASKKLWTGFYPQALKVVGAGTPPYNYQWSSNGIPIVGATSSTLLVSNLSAGGYSYTVAVGNKYGTNSSAPVLLTVATPAAGYESAVAGSSSGYPKAFWRLNEAGGNQASDLAGGHDATYLGGYLQNVAGAFPGQAGVRFFGTNAPGNVIQNATRVEAPFYPELNNPRGPISVEFWYIHNNVGNPNNSSAARYAIANMHQTGGTDNGIMFAESFNVGAAWTCLGWSYGNNNPARSVSVVQPNTLIVQGRWEHAVVTFDADNGGIAGNPASGTVSLYVNGKLEQSKSYTFHQADGINHLDNYVNNDAGPFVIGNLPNARTSAAITYAQPFNGVFADVAVYDYALTATDVSNHFFFAASAPTITLQPVGATNTESFTASVTLTAGVSGAANQNSYAWYKDGLPLSQVTNLDGTLHYPTVGNTGFHSQGVDSPKLVISELRTNDTGDYQLFVTSAVGNTNTVVAHVQINPDTIAALPQVTAAKCLKLTIGAPVWNDMYQNGALGPVFTSQTNLSLIQVFFNTPVDFATATNPANYTLSGGSGTITNVMIAANPSDLLFGAKNQYVTLQTTGLTPGANYIVTVNNVKEQRSRAATASGTLYFTTPKMTPGTLTWNYYYKVPRQSSGNSVQRIAAISTNCSGLVPFLPQKELSITNFDTHQLGSGVSSTIVGNQGDDYVAVVSGWITPTVSSTYSLFFGADDNATLWLNPIGGDGDGAVLQGGSANGSFPFTFSQIVGGSTPLVAGQTYYVTAILQENGGGEWVALGWNDDNANPGGIPTAAIPTANVMSYSSGSAPAFQGTTLSGGNLNINWTGSGRLLQSTNVALPVSQWSPVPGDPASPYVVTPGAAPQMFYRLVQ